MERVVYFQEVHLWPPRRARPEVRGLQHCAPVPGHPFEPPVGKH